MALSDAEWRSILGANGGACLTPRLVQPAFKVTQDVHVLTVEVVKREELGEVKLSILKEGNNNACLECRDGHAHYATELSS